MADLPSVNAFEIETFKKISQSNADGPVFMLNLNKYRVDAHYPNGQLYKDYMAVLDELLLQVGGEILWRTAVLGHVVGNQDIDEALGVWYPSHQAFLNLMSAPASSENMRLRALAVRGGSANPDNWLSEISASMGDGNRLPRSRSNEKTPP
jgi:hypothetical protein